MLYYYNFFQFCTMLFLFGCVQTYVCYWAYILRSALLKTGSDQIEFSLESSFWAFFPKYIDRPDHIWNRVQEEVNTHIFSRHFMLLFHFLQYKCCGVYGRAYYKRSLPTSCITDDKVHTSGCLDVLSKIIMKHLLFVAFGCLASIVLEVRVNRLKVCTHFNFVFITVDRHLLYNPAGADVGPQTTAYGQLKYAIKIFAYEARRRLTKTVGRTTTRYGVGFQPFERPIRRRTFARLAQTIVYLLNGNSNDGGIMSIYFWFDNFLQLRNAKRNS